ncbi:M20 family metallopeptidase [Luteimicrobium sp. NPDC057192]|uniref:M20 metallopeptidase family protein n=1 Tax=Luteimicrobium sp. NPDC057192 TaxID=3346042 RepID=UPI0036267920
MGTETRPERADVGRVEEALENELVALRRELHRHPELAGNEARTAALVAERLRGAGLTVTTGVGGHGVVATVEGSEPGRTIAFRADVDAVPTDERPGLDFASEALGAAHLCGHDLHTAVGVGLGVVLARAAARGELAGRVVLIFQPAEEALAGARAMLDDGVLSVAGGAGIDEIHAYHCGPLPVGAVAVGPGYGFPGIDWFRVELTGDDAAARAAAVVAAVRRLGTVGFPDSDEAFERLAEELSVPDGPHATFVLTDADVDDRPGTAVVRGWFRAWPDSRYAELRAELGAVARDADARLTFDGEPFPGMVNAVEPSVAFGDHVRGAFGDAAVEVLHAAYPFNGEDFALFLHALPGAMHILGVANPAEGLNGVPHHPGFGADERAIAFGVEAMAGFLVARASG